MLRTSCLPLATVEKLENAIGSPRLKLHESIGIYKHLESVGITRAMLYVDADNTPAVVLYRDIGLEVQVVRRLYQQ